MPINSIERASRMEKIAETYIDQQNYDLALEFLNMAKVEYFKNNKYPFRATSVFLNLGIVYEEINQNKKALESYREGLAITSKHKPESSSNSIFLERMARLYNNLDHFEKASLKQKQSINKSNTNSLNNLQASANPTNQFESNKSNPCRVYNFSKNCNGGYDLIKNNITYQNPNYELSATNNDIESNLVAKNFVLTKFIPLNEVALSFSAKANIAERDIQKKLTQDKLSSIEISNQPPNLKLAISHIIKLNQCPRSNIISHF